MTKLEELMQKYCPNGVKLFPLEQCCEILDKNRKPISKTTRKTGIYSYYGANGILDYVSDFIFEGDYVLVGEDGSVITKKGNPVVTWATGKIWVNNHAHIIKEKDGVLLRYLFHYIQTIDISSLVHGNIPKLTGSDFKGLLIPVPPLEVQREIVRVLDSFTFLSAELSAELQARKKQYEYYRDQLLVPSKGEINNCVLSDVATIRNGKDYKHLSEGGYPVYGSGGVMKYVDHYVYDKPSVLIPRKGSLSNLFYLDEPFWNVDTVFYTEINENKVVPKYLYYLLKKEHLENLNKAGGVPSLTQTILNDVRLSIPSLDVQRRIVNCLDNFESICNDLNVGLPAEIEARQKQYEYYRDMLLTFAETGDIMPQTDRQTDRQTSNN